LHGILRRLDRESALRIAPGDTQKVIRAIEIRLLSGKAASALHQKGRTGLQGFRIVKVGLMPPRAALYGRIEERVTAMLESGWLDEAKVLLDKGIAPMSKPFEFLGYSQLRDVIAGRMTLDDAVRQIQQATRRYAKRQVTWFRKEPGVHWIERFGDDPVAAEEAFRLIAAGY
jgi:tRNA dimethylallyltransferase